MLWMYGLCTYMKGEQLLKEPFQRGYTQSIPTFFQVFMGLIIKGPPSQAYIQGGNGLVTISLDGFRIHILAVFLPVFHVLPFMTKPPVPGAVH